MSEAHTERSEIDIDPNSLQVVDDSSSKVNKAYRYRYKFLHLFYWIVIGLAIWAVVELSKQQAEIQEKLRAGKTREQQGDDKIKGLQHQNQLLKLKGEEVKADLQGSSLKTNFLFRQALEEHYLKKIEGIRKLAQSQPFLREN